MPPFETMDRRHRAVWVPKTGENKFSEGTYGAAEEIRVRYVAKSREMLDAKGNQVKVDATAVVVDDIQLGDLLWVPDDQSVSALTQWYGTGSASTDDDAMEVVAVNATADIKLANTRKTVGLNKWKQLDQVRG